MNRRGRGRGRELLLGAVACALCLAALELSFRLALPTAPLDAAAAGVRDPQAILYAEAAYARHVIAPVAHTVKRGRDDFYRINAKGYRGDDFSWEKPEGTLRIAVYGGSAAFDIFAPLETHWPARLRRELAGRGLGAVEVINAGIPGHTVPDSVGRFLLQGHRLGAPGNGEEERERIHYDFVKLDHTALVEAFEATDLALRRVAREKQVALIDTTASLHGNARFFRDHVHFSEAGSEGVARVVADALEPWLHAAKSRPPAVVELASRAKHP